MFQLLEYSDDEAESAAKASKKKANRLKHRYVHEANLVLFSCDSNMHPELIGACQTMNQIQM